MSEFSINILHLYPDMLNLYGDKGNIEALRKRLCWRGIGIDVKSVTTKSDKIDFENADIIYLGGGSDREQEIVLKKLSEYKKELKDFVESGKTLIATCGGFEMLGQYLYLNNEKVDGLGILDIETIKPEGKSRLIGNIVIKTDFIDSYIVGFENHGGRIETNGLRALGKVVSGYGNNGKSGEEGVCYKNLIGTNLHGPLFPKNPKLCDYILSSTLKHKYSDFDKLKSLDDELEDLANNYIVSTYLQK